MDKKVLLMILDGWGEGVKDESNAIYVQGSPNLDSIRKKYPNSLLNASGEDVGLPEGQMGNSEVGHLNIGAGRVVYQDLVKINKDCRSKTLFNNPEIRETYDYAKKNGKALHFMGLMSDGGVHSSMEHLFAFLDLAHESGVEKVYVHAFMDGRDTDPKSGIKYIAQLEEHLSKNGAKLASIIGRYYAMDRDKRWERVKEAYDLLVLGKGEPFTSGTEAMQRSYDNGVTDEFVRANVAVDKDGNPVATLKEGDAVIFFNFRNDRARELTTVLTQEDHDIPDMKVVPLYFSTLTPYDEKFRGLHVLYNKENVTNTLGEVVSDAGKTQLRVAETEKYAHVTFFFSGGREKLFPGEDRILIKSPAVPTYDLQPEMSAYEIKDEVITALNKQKHDLIILNFANGDMVGHTGVFSAIKKAIKTVDRCTAEIVDVARENGYSVIITADHGNADNAVNADGTPNTAHSLNPVPFVVIDKEVTQVKGGKLADIAPTILKIMRIPAPADMTGEPLV
ncbi:MAG: 2,3-bisphosphoglycerate-independent phosphoglycerate mutase [Bacteroidales bacterium]|nr:2,3-bisphosphoglycerate-independent phosphoglycerate mutase [Bacteroidales bacterium]MDD3299767.1 2,3-bisphosphoglycerate-independent phosphoglycerate mutase [Bacteroidales bacterium]MDD3843495.1 2,3-bisphosphoglycerate-independent phosphoglycerate mutase [Bacteroidales bacterium]MDD4617863.1 2,3-bisphosphoglycerate-independent phosphoglycerate mutase [Bacteroidales bacterium]